MRSVWFSRLLTRCPVMCMELKKRKLPFDISAVAIASVLALIGIKVLISSFDDDDDDGGGMGVPVSAPLFAGAPA